MLGRRAPRATRPVRRRHGLATPHGTLACGARDLRLGRQPKPWYGRCCDEQHDPANHDRGFVSCGPGHCAHVAAGGRVAGALARRRVVAWRRDRWRLRHWGRLLRSGHGHRVSGRSGHRRLRRAHLLRRRLLLGEQRWRLVPIVVLHGRLDLLLASARRHRLDSQSACLPALSAARLGATRWRPSWSWWRRCTHRARCPAAARSAAGRIRRARIPQQSSHERGTWLWAWSRTLGRGAGCAPAAGATAARADDGTRTAPLNVIAAGLSSDRHSLTRAAARRWRARRCRCWTGRGRRCARGACGPRPARPRFPRRQSSRSARIRDAGSRRRCLG